MKVFFISIGVLLILVTGFLLLSSPESKQSFSDESNASSILSLEEELKSGVAMIDVRTSEEYAEGHIQGAKLFPLADIQSGQFPEVDKDSKLYVYCRSGNRSEQATLLLEDAGFSNVIDLGALTDVVALGGKIVK